MPRGYQLDHPASFMSSIQNEDYSHNIHGEFSMVFLTALSRTFAPHTSHSARLSAHHCQQGDFLSHRIKVIISDLATEFLVSPSDLQSTGECICSLVSSYSCSLHCNVMIRSFCIIITVLEDRYVYRNEFYY